MVRSKRTKRTGVPRVVVNLELQAQAAERPELIAGLERIERTLRTDAAYRQAYADGPVEDVDADVADIVRAARLLRGDAHRKVAKLARRLLDDAGEAALGHSMATKRAAALVANVRKHLSPNGAVGDQGWKNAVALVLGEAFGLGATLTPMRGRPLPDADLVDAKMRKVMRDKGPGAAEAIVKAGLRAMGIPKEKVQTLFS
jgi:hypothetical protein